VSGVSLVTGGLVPASGVSLVTGGLIDSEMITAAGPGVGADAPIVGLSARVFGSSIIDVPDHLQWNLTPESLASVGLDPIIPGEYIEYRHQVVDVDGNAVSLDGAQLVMTLYRLDSLDSADLIFRRRTRDTIQDWDPATQQLDVDADQSIEDVNAGTGTGWWTMTFAPTDEALLLSSVGSWWYDVRALFADLKIRTLLRGRIQIPWPRTVVADFS